MTREEFKAKYWFLEHSYNELIKMYADDLWTLQDQSPDKTTLIQPKQ